MSRDTSIKNLIVFYVAYIFDSTNQYSTSMELAQLGHEFMIKAKKISDKFKLIMQPEDMGRISLFSQDKNNIIDIMISLNELNNVINKKVAIGIDQGECIVSERVIRNKWLKKNKEFTILGATINEAARLCKIAVENNISMLVGEDVAITDGLVISDMLHEVSLATEKNKKLYSFMIK